MSKRSVDVNLTGCIPLVVSILVLWGLVFGVTIGGKHHELSCSCSKGVEVETKP